MKRRPLHTLGVLCVALSLFSCTPALSVNTASEEIPEIDIGSEHDTIIENSEIEADAGSLTIDEAIASPGLYIVRDGQYYSFNTAIYKHESTAFSLYEYLSKTDQTGETAVIDLSSGDQLITTKAQDEYYASAVIEQGFMVDSPRFGLYSELAGKELDNLNPSESAKDMLLEKGIAYENGFLTSANKTSFVLGGYEGTKFVENTVTLDKPYLKTWESTNSNKDKIPPIQLPTEKTKEGYFIVDTSGLVPGMYVMQLHCAFIVK